MARLKAKYRNICDKLGWWVREYDDYVEVGKYSPAGEDFFFIVTAENFAREVDLYADKFDPDEHIEMWIEARRNGVQGVPTTRELVDDAEEIQKMLDELAKALTADSKSAIKERGSR